SPLYTILADLRSFLESKKVRLKSKRQRYRFPPSLYRLKSSTLQKIKETQAYPPSAQFDLLCIIPLLWGKYKDVCTFRSASADPDITAELYILLKLFGCIIFPIAI
ncbi:hypothetical protein, partial [Hungatella effluvii]|uniref:hypothetical protein n=1 Tax=Hungatella effluvii TaxID=1096246 RepID=UPI002A7FB155